MDSLQRKAIRSKPYRILYGVLPVFVLFGTGILIGMVFGITSSAMPVLATTTPPTSPVQDESSTTPPASPSTGDDESGDNTPPASPSGPENEDGGTPPTSPVGPGDEGDGDDAPPTSPVGPGNEGDGGENTPPEITLLGDKNLILTIGDSFTDPGATASDTEDGDITGDIVVAGSVDPGTLGLYKLTYNVTDSDGATAEEKVRTVQVQPLTDLPYAPYCGDGEINQTWEQCDGGGSCTEQCLAVPPPTSPVGPGDEGGTPPDSPVGPGDEEEMCTDIVLARINVENVENWNGGNMTSDIYLGSATNKIPAGKWFLLHLDGSFEIDPDMISAGYENVAGLAVERRAGSVRIQEYGFNPSNGSGRKEHIRGSLELSGVLVDGQTSDSPRPLENGFDGEKTFSAGQDEVWTDNDEFSNFWLTVTTHGDSFFTEYGDVPMCPLTPAPECSDGLDNDNDGDTDIDDAACHTDGDPGNPDSYDPDIDDENEAPEITLLGANPISITQGGSFTDPGATASDPEDGDITGDIIVGGDTVDTGTVGSYTITYNVTDSQGKDAPEVTRTVNVTSGGGGGGENPQCSDSNDNDGDGDIDEDDSACHTDGDPDNTDSYDPNIDDENSAPTITLIGDNPFSITVGNSFTDPGANAEDPEDGDITDDIVAGGDTVDKDTVGSYTITYNVSDSNGKPAPEVTRTVNVNSGGGGGGGGGCTSNCGGGGGGGGTPIIFDITNEAVTQTGPNTARVTWDSNLQGTSQVAYGLVSYATSTLSTPINLPGTPTTTPVFNTYPLATNKTDILATTHSMEITGLTPGIPYYFRPVSDRSDKEAIGEEVTITLSGDVVSCTQYLTTYIKLGQNNHEGDVRRLESFLNSHEGESLPVDGIYSQADFDAVSRFQAKYGNDVLTPWGLPGSTGYVYYTTQKKVNELYCLGQTYPLTQAQLDEIAAFRALIESQPGIPTGNVGVVVPSELPDNLDVPEDTFAYGDFDFTDGDRATTTSPDDGNGPTFAVALLSIAELPAGAHATLALLALLILALGVLLGLTYNSKDGSIKDIYINLKNSFSNKKEA